jgi:hypothetical protein
VPVGLTLYHITHASFNSAPHGVFLGYSNMYKGFKCINISTDRIYILCDVVIYETTFPFADLHSNAGSRYTSEVLLFPSSHTSGNITDLPIHNVLPVTNPPHVVFTNLFHQVQPQKIPAPKSTLCVLSGADSCTRSRRTVACDPKNISCLDRCIHSRPPRTPRNPCCLMCMEARPMVSLPTWLRSPRCHFFMESRPIAMTPARH